MSKPDASTIAKALACGKPGCPCLRTARTGKGNTHCPSHADNKPSLSVEEKGGKLLINCKAGCTQGSVIAALKDLDLWPQRGNGHQPGGRVVAVYDYTDADGKLLYQVVRLEPKDFRQRRPDGNGDWVWNLDGVEPVLYRLPEVLAAVRQGRPLYVCEGEKDADALRSLGLVGTTNPRGALKWRDTYSESLHGATVVILPDKDAPGRGHASQVAASLHGKAKSFKVLELADRDGCQVQDVSDWLDAGGTLAELEQLVIEAPEWNPPSGVARDRFRLTPLADLLSEPPASTPYLWVDTLPTGGISILAAKPKAGKTTMGLNLALRVARGEDFLDRGTTAGPVVYLALEEKRSEIAAHFVRMGAGEEEISIHTGSAPEEALVALDAAIRETGAVLAVVDPLQRLIRLHDGNDYTEVTRALEPLMNIARSSGCHIMLIHHLGKGGDQREGGDGILGSTALFGGVDTALIMRRREDGRTIESIQRYGTDLPRTLLTLDPVTGLVEANGTVEEMELARAAAAICETLGEGDLTEKELRETLAGNTGLVGKALRWLHQEGYVRREGAGKRGAPYLYILVSRFSYIDKREKQENEKPSPSVLRI